MGVLAYPGYPADHETKSDDKVKKTIINRLPTVNATDRDELTLAALETTGDTSVGSPVPMTSDSTTCFPLSRSSSPPRLSYEPRELSCL